VDAVGARPSYPRRVFQAGRGPASPSNPILMLSRVRLIHAFDGDVSPIPGGFRRVRERGRMDITMVDAYYVKYAWFDDDDALRLVWRREQSMIAPVFEVYGERGNIGRHLYDLVLYSGGARPVIRLYATMYEEHELHRFLLVVAEYPFRRGFEEASVAVTRGLIWSSTAVSLHGAGEGRVLITAIAHAKDGVRIVHRRVEDGREYVTVDLYSGGSKRTLPRIVFDDSYVPAYVDEYVRVGHALDNATGEVIPVVAIRNRIGKYGPRVRFKFVGRDSLVYVGRVWDNDGRGYTDFFMIKSFEGELKVKVIWRGDDGKEHARIIDVFRELGISV